MREAQHEVGTQQESKKKVITVDDVRGDVPPMHAGQPGSPGSPGAPGAPTSPGGTPWQWMM